MAAPPAPEFEAVEGSRSLRPEPGTEGTNAWRSGPVDTRLCHRSANGPLAGCVIITAMRGVILASIATMWGCSGGGGSAALPPAPATATPPVVQATAPAPEHEDFEAANPGDLPPGWTIAAAAKNITFAAAHADT